MKRNTFIGLSVLGLISFSCTAFITNGFSDLAEINHAISTDGSSSHRRLNAAEYHGPILSDAEEDYAYKNNTAYYPHYTSTNYALNEERKALVCTDTQSSVYRLSPTNNINSAPNHQFNDSISMRITEIYALPSKSFYNNDSRTLNDLNYQINTTLNNAVGTGAFLYRIKNVGNNWNLWNYVPLADGQVLNFSGNIDVQCASIYEIREEGYNWFQPTNYFHVRGIYSFSIRIVWSNVN